MLRLFKLFAWLETTPVIVNAPAINLPELRGNLLILEVSDSFSIISGQELNIQNLKINNRLLEIEPSICGSHWNMITSNSNIYDPIDDLSYPMVKNYLLIGYEM